MLGCLGQVLMRRSCPSCSLPSRGRTSYIDSELRISFASSGLIQVPGHGRADHGNDPEAGRFFGVRIALVLLVAAFATGVDGIHLSLGRGVAVVEVYGPNSA